MPIVGITASQVIKSLLPPGTPAITSFSDVGSSRPYNNGSAIIYFSQNSAGGFVSEFRVYNASTNSVIGTGTSSPITITGLASNVTLSVYMTAFSTISESAPTATVGPITITTVPQAPTIGTASAGNASASVTFTANNNGGKVVSTFIAVSSPGGLTGSGGSPITISSLTNSTAYTFTVSAINANGASLSSSSSNSATPTAPVTPPTGPPPPPPPTTTSPPVTPPPTTPPPTTPPPTTPPPTTPPPTTPPPAGQCTPSVITYPAGSGTCAGCGGSECYRNQAANCTLSSVYC